MVKKEPFANNCKTRTLPKSRFGATRTVLAGGNKPHGEDQEHKALHAVMTEINQAMWLPIKGQNDTGRVTK